ncbi:MAG: hypothetical protein H6822_24975 [Planctomycetaceae bacterium]|nr:hypothetical protein [Planctomycetales bacterium]MCB9925431.1 hypothetical protein [Planctomycetaceae bacterium]
MNSSSGDEKTVAENDAVEVVVTPHPSGVGYRTRIRDKSTDTEKVGTACPGDPDDYDYDITTDTWSTKST